MRKLIALALLVLLSGAYTSLASGAARRHRGHASRAVLLLGLRSTQGQPDRETVNRSQAFPFTELRSGRAQSVSLYVDGPNQARTAHVAIYSGAAGQPGVLLSSGSRRRPAAGRWNRITVRNVKLYAGRTYWLAVLGTGGKLAFRDRSSSSCRSQESAQANLIRFPARWSPGPRWGVCGLSAFVSGPASATPKAPAKPSPPKPQPPVTPPPGPTGPPPSRTNCIARPSACGYPDLTNTGVPAGTSLRPSGSIVVNQPGAVISGVDVSGTISVYADNVTIKNSRVTNAWPSGFAIRIASNAHNALIEDSTIRGRDGGGGSVEYAVENGGYVTRSLRLQMYNCTECYNGAGLLQDSYANVNATVDGAHYEDIYYGGGTNQGLTAEHNTLLNPQDQTAVVFGGTDFGPQQNLTVDNNLLAGGGYMIYAGSNDSGTTGVRITNNRISNIYFPKGGFFGVIAYVNWAVTTFTGNYWDNSLSPIHG